MQNPSNLCTLIAPAPARGLAVSATGERSGCTTSLHIQKTHGWQTAHKLAVEAICIVVQSRPVKRAWPFMVQVVSFDVDALASGERSEAAAAASAQLVHAPHGNHGVYLSKSLGGVE